MNTIDASTGDPRSAAAGWRARLHEVIFEADTPLGRAFDVTLLACIAVSVVAVLLESVASIRARWGGPLRFVEWTLTVLFSIEYLLRLLSVGRPLRADARFCKFCGAQL
jgi:voltage-gated potassium channel